jgi:hypothetical protein
MAHKYKVGDRVILGKHINRENFIDYMDQFVGKEVILHSIPYMLVGGKPSWYVSLPNTIERIGCYWHEDVMQFVGCPCNINTCLKHRAANGRSK